MDADRVRRHGRVGKLAVVVAVQNVLVAACLLVTVYFYFKTHGEKASEDIVHIQFDATSVSTGNALVHFNRVASRKNVTLCEDKSKIHIHCTGPYVWHMNVCYKSMNEGKTTTGTLQLRVEGNDTPIDSIPLNASTEVCRWRYSIAFLRAEQRASLYLKSEDGFKIKNVTVALSYLLGKKC